MSLLADEATLADAESEIASGTAGCVRFTIWDLAGQTVFYDLLHILLTSHALYVVCFDMADLTPSLGPSRPSAASSRDDGLAYIKFWLNSIHLHAPRSAVVLVGTHKDAVPEHRVHEDISKALRTMMAGHPCLKHVVFNTADSLLFFPIDNKKGSKDPTIARLRKSIEECAQQQDFVRYEIPALWLAGLDAVRDHARKAGVQRLSLKEVQAVLQGFKIAGNDVDLVLKLFHEFGMWLHFAEPSLRETLVVDPQWIVDSFTCIIRDFSLHTKEQDREALKLAMEFDELSSHARLHEALIPLLWARHSEAERGMLIQLMRNFHMMLPYRLHGAKGAGDQAVLEAVAGRGARSKQGHGAGKGVVFLVPSLLPHDLTGSVAGDADVHTDALSAKYVSRLARYTGPSSDLGADWCEWLCYFSPVEPRLEGGAVDVAQLEKLGFLPHGLFLRISCELLRHHQYTSTARPKLSQTATVVFMGPVKVQLELVAHSSLVRVRAQTTTAIPVMRRLHDVLGTVLEHHFPGIMCWDLLALSASQLLSVVEVQNFYFSKRVLQVEPPLSPSDMEQRLGAVLPRTGLREAYHAMISYRQNANSKFASKLHDALSVTMVEQMREQIAVFYDQVSLERGRMFAHDFCQGIVRSTVLLPVMSTQAVEKMCSLDGASAVDNLLLEWMLMFVLMRDGTRAATHRVMPIVVCDSWSNDGSPASMATIGAFLSWVRNKAPDVHATATEKQLVGILGHLGLAAPAMLPSVRETVLGLLDFDASLCVQVGAGAGPSTHPQGVEDEAWDIFERLADSVRQLVDAAHRVPTKPGASGMPDSVPSQAPPRLSAGGAVGTVEDWTVDDVCAMLHSIGLGEHADAFRRKGIHGVLFSMLTDAMLEKKLGVTDDFDRAKILAEQRRLKRAGPS